MSFDPFDERLYEPINEVKGWQKPADPNSNRSLQKTKDAQIAQVRFEYEARRQDEIEKRTAAGYKFVTGFGYYMYNDPQLTKAWKNIVMSAKKTGTFDSFPSAHSPEGRKLYREALKNLAWKFITDKKLIKEIPTYGWRNHGDDSLTAELIERAEEFLYIEEDEGDGRGGKGLISSWDYPDPINHKELV